MGALLGAPQHLQHFRLGRVELHVVEELLNFLRRYEGVGPDSARPRRVQLPGLLARSPQGAGRAGAAREVAGRPGRSARRPSRGPRVVGPLAPEHADHALAEAEPPGAGRSRAGRLAPAAQVVKD